MPATSLAVGIVIGGALRSSVKTAFGGVDRRSRQLGSALRNTERRADHMRQRLARMSDEQRRAGAGSERLADRIRLVGLALDRTTAKASRYRREIGRADRQARTAAAREGLGRARVAAGTAVGGAYAAGRLISSALERDEAAARLSTVLVTDDLEKDLERGLDHAREMVRERRTLHSEVELLGVQYSLSSAGLDAETARIGSVIGSRLATATGGASEQVADVLATVSQNFKEDLTRVGDVLAHTQATYQFAHFGLLGEGLATAANRARIARLPLDQTAVALGLLAKAGTKGSEGGTALEATLRQLVPASDKLGFSIERTVDGGLLLPATLANIQASLERFGDDPDLVGAALQEAFGDEGIKGLSPLLGFLGEFSPGLDGVAASTGKLDRMFSHFADASSGKAKNLWQNVAVLGRTLGEAPETGAWTDWANSTVVSIGETIEQSDRLRKSIVYLGLAIGGLAAGRVAFAAGRFALAPVVGGAKQAWDWTRRGRGVGGAAKGAAGAAKVGAATAKVGRLGGAMRLVGKVAAGLVGIVGIKFVAIGALVAGAAYLIRKHWGGITGFFKGLMGRVGAVFGPAVGAWGKVFTDFSWSNVGDAIMKTLAAGITAGIGWPYNAVKAGLGKVRELLPFSDARAGPLSGLTASGGVVLRTIGDGVSRAGPGGLRGPLVRQLGAAAAGLTLAATPALAASLDPVVAPPVVEPLVATPDPLSPVVSPPVVEPLVATPAAAAGFNDEPLLAAESTTAPVVNKNFYDHSRYTISVQAAPGEDVRRLADRLMAEIDRRRQVRRRRELDDQEA